MTAEVHGRKVNVHANGIISMARRTLTVDNAKMFNAATTATTIPMPPYIYHSGNKKKKYCPRVSRKMDPAMLYACGFSE